MASRPYGPPRQGRRGPNELRLQGVQVSPSGVRGVWLRHGLETRTQRLLRLEKKSQEETFVLSEEQIRLLERHSPDLRCRHIEVSRPGELLNQDTFYWGTLKGVGKVYVQVVIDAFCSLAFAKLYTSTLPVTAADLLYDRVLPFYEALEVKVESVLTDNGREFCGRQETHPYELLLALEDVDHRTTKVRSPRTNGFVERMNRTLLDECFRVHSRTTWYEGVDEIQADLDRFLLYYNLERSHQGYRLRGRTPAQALREALGIDELPPLWTTDNDHREEADPVTVYERIYCARGEMENRIKEQQLYLFADRTSARSMAVNQLRLWFSSVAYTLLAELRRLGLAGSEMARARCDSIRLKLLKTGARIRVSVRWVTVSLASACPHQAVFWHAWDRLARAGPGTL